MNESDVQVGELLTQPYDNDEWAKVTVELTEKQMTVKMRDLVQEDTLATHEIVNKRSITLKRVKTRLGLYVQGGLEYKSPIKINRILQKSPASKQEMAPLDIVLKVNDISLWGKTHSEASKIIKDSGDEVTFEIGKLVEREVEVPVDKKWIIIAIVPIDRASVTKFKPGTCTLRPCKFEVMSKDGKQKVTLKCENEGECADWIRFISEHIQRTVELKIEQYNNNTGSEDEKIIQMGWVYEHIPANLQTKVWCRKVFVLKKTSLLLYEIMPDAIEEYERPEKQYNLLEMTLKVLPPHSFKNQRPNTLAILSGTGYQHTISCETESDISSWTSQIHRATVATVMSVKHCFYAGTCEDRHISLGLDIDRGILILDDSVPQMGDFAEIMLTLTLSKRTRTRGLEGFLDSGKQVLWQKPFSLICKSSDDTQTKLQITFYTDSSKEDKEDLVVELENLQFAICGLDCFMTTKVALMDPQFIKEKTDLLAGRTQPRQ